MQNGYRHLLAGKFAPETAVGTGAANPLVVEYDAAVAAKNVDESTLGSSKKSKNLPATPPKLTYHADNGAKGGEESEVRTNANAHKSDADANKLAAEARPAKPQAVQKNSRNAPTS